MHNVPCDKYPFLYWCSSLIIIIITQGVQELEEALGSRLQALRAQAAQPPSGVARRVSVMQDASPSQPAFQDQLPKVLLVVMCGI